MKILVVQNKMGIGDMVIYLPFIDAISKKFNTPVSILAKQSSKAEQFLRDNKNIEKVLIFGGNEKEKGTVMLKNLAAGSQKEIALENLLFEINS